MSKARVDVDGDCFILGSLLYYVIIGVWSHYCVSYPQEKYKMMPFHGCFLSFHGFSDEEKKHMEESTEQQGMFQFSFNITYR